MEKHIFKEDPVTKALQMGSGSPEYIATFGQQPHDPILCEPLPPAHMNPHS